MATPRWQAGTLYPTGSLVQPLTAAAGVSAAITNPGFESGSTDWTLGAGMSVVAGHQFSGASSLQCSGVAGITVAIHTAMLVNPGQSITATCMYQQGAASSGKNVGQVILRWYTSGMVQIGTDVDGSAITSSSGGYKQSTVTGIAPATAAYVAIGGKVNRNQSNNSWFDAFAWNYVTAPAPAGLIYKAVQPTIGTSDASEPAWPSVAGVQVVDGTVIWEAIIATRVTWEASPILVSGATEPVWPEAVGDFIADGTISWKTVPRQVVQAPQSKVVTIASSKVYAADEDIVRYSATVNPLDWTTENDAGYLPTGLNQYGSNRTAVLNTYRGNVVPFSASTFQNWQVDPDPANITLLDTMEGIGSTYQQAAHPVANDLFYLSPLGVRTVGIAAGTSNLAAGDAGAPIDPLVQDALSSPGMRPLGGYYPNQGQYWLCMRPPLPVVEGPTITGNAPDGAQDEAYPGYEYTVTPGDAPIVSVELYSGEVPTGVSYDDAVLGTELVTGAGQFNFSQIATDQNGLTFIHPDTVFIESAPITWMMLVDGLLFGVNGDWSAPTQPSPGTIGWALVAWGGGELLMSDRGDNVAWSSDKGANWTVSTLPETVAGNRGDMLYANGYWWVPSGTITPVQRGDGVTFTQPASGAAAEGETISIVTAEPYDRLVMAAPFQAKASFSTNNGASWAFGTGDMKAGAIEATEVALSSNGTRLVLAGNFGASHIAYSDDGGNTWTAVTSPFVGGAAFVNKYRGGKFIIGSTSGEIAYSEDGETFVLAGDTGTSLRCYDLDYDGTRYTAIFSDSSVEGYMIESLDEMLTWDAIVPSTGDTTQYGIVAMTP